MEDFIVYGIIIISVIASIIKNFTKDNKENEKRVIGKKPEGQSEPSQTPVPPLFSKPKPNQNQSGQYETIKKIVKNDRPIIESDLERIDRDLATKMSYNSSSIEDMVSKKNFSADEIAAFQESDIFQDMSTLEEDDIAAASTENKLGELFESKDDFKKAILYSTILERKY